MRSLPALALLVLAIPAGAADPAPPPAEVRACLPIAAIRETRVLNDSTIDFIQRDGSVWRSSLPNRCPALGFERAFSYQTAMSQLCKQDIITVVVHTGNQLRGASCGLGEFRRQPAPAAKSRERR